MKNTLIVRGLG